MLNFGAQLAGFVSASTFLKRYLTRPKQAVNLAEALGAVRHKAETKNATQTKCALKKKESAGKGKGKSSGESSKANKKGGTAAGDKRPPNIIDKCQIFQHEQTNAEFWRKISFALVPFAFILSFVVLMTRPEPIEHDFVPYEYLYRHNKRYPWGDGRLTLFHSKHNFDPQEEEEKIDKEEEAKEAEKPPPPPPPKKGQAPPPPPPEKKEPRYKCAACEKEKEAKKELREQHAKEEMARRKRRHEIENERPNRLKKKNRQKKQKADDNEANQEQEQEQEPEQGKKS